MKIDHDVPAPRDHAPLKALAQKMAPGDSTVVPTVEDAVSLRNFLERRAMKPAVRKGSEGYRVWCVGPKQPKGD